MLMLTFADDVDIHSWSASIQTGGRLEDEAFGNNGQMTKVISFFAIFNFGNNGQLAKVVFTLHTMSSS